ncbi:MAG: eukaryotic-like serine/threonine-protein kinase [Myxococcales bacterium]|nr:eukaryotic-like serine/threonine-protein kinase [Myxococcales bacterium]
MRLLDRYTILDRIGSGGMATIYRATDDRLDRVVCIKLLRTTLIEGSGSNNTGGRAVYQATYSHFLQEALALSKLQHPNTLRIYDFGYLDPSPHASPEPGAPFHVSEYLDGGNLETHIRLRGAIPADEALGILESISGALAEAHEHGIIHRDIKPSNILFARVRGALVPKLADFGIAHSDIKKKQREGTPNTFDGIESVSTVALFSPRWAAPEQLCGSPEGPRTDVYALGLLAVFMLTGRVIFGDEDVRLTFNDRVRGDTLVNARLAQIGLAGDVAKVLSHSMIARADDRIATAPDLFEHLREALKVRAPTSIAPFPIEPSAQQMQQMHHQHQQQQQNQHQQQLPTPPQPVGLALEVEASGSEGAPLVQPAPERVTHYGERRVRFVQVHEKLDLSFVDREGGHVRVRVTMLPGAAGAQQKLNVKGLTCFVARRGQRPTPALTVTADGSADLVSSTRVTLGELTWSFGQATPEGRVFVVDGRQLLVPYSEGHLAIALLLSPGNDLVVMCRR